MIPYPGRKQTTWGLLHQRHTKASEIKYNILAKATFEQNPREGLELIFKRYYNPLCKLNRESKPLMISSHAGY
jgi:RNA polymerase sigma-70 factor (ECF subfamily)